MLTLTETNNVPILSNIITNPVLWRLTYGQGQHLEKFKPDLSFKYLLLENEVEPVGCILVKEITKVLIEVHMCILPKYWGDKESQEAVKIGHKWAIEKGYKTVFTYVPQNCVHMLKFMNRIMYTPCGMIKKGIIYNKILVPLIMYQYDLESEASNVND